ncbi:hypothetical protein EV121DRAFT_292312 [Schizophyllum commune]
MHPCHRSSPKNQYNRLQRAADILTQTDTQTTSADPRPGLNDSRRPPCSNLRTDRTPRTQNISIRRHVESFLHSARRATFRPLPLSISPLVLYSTAFLRVVILYLGPLTTYSPNTCTSTRPLYYLFLRMHSDVWLLLLLCLSSFFVAPRISRPAAGLRSLKLF